jgi:hypothetical protein
VNLYLPDGSFYGVIERGRRPRTFADLTGIPLRGET